MHTFLIVAVVFLAGVYSNILYLYRLNKSVDLLVKMMEQKSNIYRLEYTADKEATEPFYEGSFPPEPVF